MRGGIENLAASSLSDWGSDLREVVNSAANRPDVIMMAAVLAWTHCHAGFGDTRRQRAQPGLSANIRLMFHAIVTRLHSPRTLSSPRSRNWRNPITDLMIPNTGSGVCLRRA